MKDINKLVENYFNSPNKTLKTPSFLELIKETLEEVNQSQKRSEGLLGAIDPGEEKTLQEETNTTVFHG